MDRVKQQFSASTASATLNNDIQEKVDKVPAKKTRHQKKKDDKIKSAVDRLNDYVTEDLEKQSKMIKFREIHLLTEQREKIPEARVVEGNERGGKWLMDTVIYTGDGFQSVRYTTVKTVGSGSFGLVFKATCNETGQIVAIKKVLQDSRFKNRELQIMKLLNHPNIVKLHNSFTSRTKHNHVYLHLVLDYIPDTIHHLTRSLSRSKQNLPILCIKLYLWQLCRSLAYLHAMGICHRDIKPQNLLVDIETHKLYLCDFGSAKVLLSGEPNISYICSRFYRAPELILGAAEYTTSIDMWSVGCVMAELFSKEPLFPGDSALGQIVQIIKILGTPDTQQLQSMNPNCTNFTIPQMKKEPLHYIFPRAPEDALDFMSKLLAYNPNSRLTARDALEHPFFNELKNSKTILPNGRPLPPLFNWTPDELMISCNLPDISKLNIN